MFHKNGCRFYSNRASAAVRKSLGADCSVSGVPDSKEQQWKQSSDLPVTYRSKHL